MRSLFLLIWLAAMAVACGGPDRSSADAVVRAEENRITAKPGRGGGNCRPGEQTLRLGAGRTALIRVTAGGRGGRKALLVVLHGAGSGSTDGLYAFRGGWAEPGLVLVAPAAAGSTWSYLTGTDTDLKSVDRALRQAFAQCRVDPRLIGVGGFSDGATYALTLGLTNGDLFRAVVALSPGGLVADAPVGTPRIFLAHGTRDGVLPISGTSDVVFRELRGAGYSVTYRRFIGDHEARPDISRAAVRWFLRRQS